MWTSLYYYDLRRPPVLGKERFYASSGGLKRLLSETLEKPDFIDSLRRLSEGPCHRPRGNMQRENRAAVFCGRLEPATFCICPSRFHCAWRGLGRNPLPA
jgi:hypothetical protein